MHVFYSRQDTLCKALLTERVQLYITGAYLLPCRTVAFVFLVSPSVLFVLPVGYCFMFLAIQSVRQLQTAGVIARFLWFSWHRVQFLLIITGIKNAILRYLDIYKNAILSFCIEKAADQFLLLIYGFVFLFFHGTIISHFILYYTVFYCIVLCGMEIFLIASRCSL